VESIFGVPWERVELEDVAAFLETAGDEGIRWEAKATDPRRPEAPIEAHLIRAAVCGLANSIGGYVIIGATRDRETGAWSLPGVVFPSEPTTWLDDVAGSLRPRPRTGDPKVWDVSDGNHVAVVQVEPVAVPPCMTAGGQIWERTSGKTVRVTDPLVLARLTERGESAREAAKAGARAVAATVNEGALRSDNRGLIVRLGLRATGYDYDISAHLFRRSTAAQIQQIVVDNLKQDRDTRNQPPTIQVHQDTVSAFTVPGQYVGNPGGGDRMWQVVATWNGAVGIRCEGNDREIGIELLFNDIIVPAWRAAASVVPLLGGVGSGHLVLDARSTIHTGREGDVPRNVHGESLEREVDPVDVVDPVLVESLKREVLRSIGHSAWEPEPNAEQAEPSTT
jgi:hypothetical protein